MTTKQSLQLAAQAWCTPSTEKVLMDERLAAAFSTVLVNTLRPLEDHLELAWGVIANSGGGNWSKESPEWQIAARKWRDQYHALLSSQIRQINHIMDEIYH